MSFRDRGNPVLTYSEEYHIGLIGFTETLRKDAGY